MTNLLIRLFIKNPDDVHDEKTRLAYSTLASTAGILCNLFLFFLKLGIGLSMNAVSIVSDGFNNLSDGVNCLLELFGYKLSAKPADREHPFGHGRLEYIVSFIVSIIIFIFSWELFRESIQKIMHPEEVNFSLPSFLILLASILIKLWMARFYEKISSKIDSLALKASAKDSRNDVLVTAVSLTAVVMSAFTAESFPFDGIAGVILAVFVFFSAAGIAREIISRMIGRPASSQLISAIRAQMLSHPEILGVHDMIIHDYGPGVQIGSAHAELDSRMTFIAAHNIIDEIEEEIEKNQHVMMTIHMDPVVIGDPETDAYHQKTLQIVQAVDPGLSIHDFRMVKNNAGYHLIFDVLIPYTCRKNKDEIKKDILNAYQNDPKKLLFTIHFDHGYLTEE